MKKYLITGGAGFIGRNVTTSLLKKGMVRVLDNEFRQQKFLFPKNNNLQFVKGDIRDLKTVLKATTDIDCIIHLAFINGTKYFYEKPDLVLSVGVRGMLNVLDAAKAKGVKELFVASSSEVYQTPPLIPTPEDVPFSIPDLKNPRFSYAGGKIISELLSYYIGKTFLKKMVIFRPHNVYGPNMGEEHVIPELITKILSQTGDKISLAIQGTGKDTRAFMYIDDFVSALSVLLKSGKNGEVYNIGTQEETSIIEIVQLLSSISRKNISLTQSPKPQGSVSRRCPDITRIVSLGFSSKNSLEDGLRETFIWYNTHRNTT